MSFKLFMEALLKFVLGIVIVGLLVFLPAGTFNYDKGWLFMGVLFIPIFIAGVIMMIFNPSLLRARLEAKEKQKVQGVVIKLSGLMFIIGFVIAGLDFRFKWLVLPNYVSYIASFVFILSYLVFGEVSRENTYLFKTIKVEQGQKIVDRGLYGIVRHPMYSATIFLFLSMPLILGSLISFFIFLLYPVLIVVRTLNEEKVLTDELDGYKEYKGKVRWRLFPYIW